MSLRTVESILLCCVILGFRREADEKCALLIFKVSHPRCVS